MNCFLPVINPDRKLKKMVNLSNIILIIQIIINTIKFNHRIAQEILTDTIIDILSFIFLLLMNYTFFYIYGGLYLIITFLNILYLFFDIGIFFQNYFLYKSIKMHINTLIIITICLSFYIFSLIVIFKIFKELKTQYLELIGIRYLDRNNNGNNNNIDNNNERNNNHNNNNENNNINNNINIIVNENQYPNNEEDNLNQN
jgi:hypothetical protein